MTGPHPSPWEGSGRGRAFLWGKRRKADFIKESVGNGVKKLKAEWQHWEK